MGKDYPATDVFLAVNGSNFRRSLCLTLNLSPPGEGPGKVL